MSVFGGDSWGREAQYRKRRVDDLILESIDSSSSSYMKLPNGKFSCLVCPQRPILDTPLVLSTHMKGSRHRAAELKFKERELAIQDERNKRLALSNCSTAVSNASGSAQRLASANAPLIQHAQKAASDILNRRSRQESKLQKSQDIRSYKSAKTTDQSPYSQDKGTCIEAGAVSREIASNEFDFRARRERELKFTAAGWKRDCHGKWFKDENVEFDSDEEDPNVCLEL